MSFLAPRFDDRATEMNSGDNGADFQRFVWEVLYLGYFDRELSTRAVRPRFTRGNDGAIDHIVETDTGLFVIECKFFGKDREGDPRTEWSKLAGPLHDRLRDYASRQTVDAVPTISTPWFDRRQPIQGYWFCTSGIFPNAGAQSDLRRKIEAFFAEIAAEYEPLAHLARVRVTVREWNDFEGALSVLTSLRYRWFGGLPDGVMPLEGEVGAHTFRRFLSERGLPYFSRDLFNRENEPSGGEPIEDEISLLARALDEDARGFVIAGVGGVGKTRLALELGRKAENLRWEVHRVSNHISAEAVQQLARMHGSIARVLLVIDYAEATQNLTELVLAMQRANEDGGHNFRFIATCRSSSLQMVREALEDVSPELVELSGATSENYASWIVGKILAYGGVTGADTIAAACRRTPVLAAFAVFLFQRDRENFDEQFSGLRREDDFAVWVNRRLRFALSARGVKGTAADRLLAVVAICLPLSFADCETLRKMGDHAADILEVLEWDRWIERDGDRRVAAHDIFADTIIARYVFQNSVAVTDRLGDVLMDALRLGALGRALVALGRVSAWGDLDAIDGAQIVTRLYRWSSAEVLKNRVGLFTSPLITPRSAMSILDDHPDLSEAIRDDPRCYGRLAYLAGRIARSDDEKSRGDAAESIAPLLDAALKRNIRYLLVLREALPLLPERYRDRALAWITQHPTRPDTRYILVAWMRAGLPLREISAFLDVWLAARAVTEPETYSVLWNWHKAGGALADVETHTVSWLGRFELLEGATFACTFWLYKGGDPKKIESHVVAWLEQYVTTERAGYLLSSWIDACGDLDKVGRYVLTWLEQYETVEQAAFVYAAWLKTRRPYGDIEPYLLNWIEQNKTNATAQRVYTAWLIAERDLSDVETLILNWLGEHERRKDALWMYRGFLKAGGDPDKVVSHVVAWFDTWGKILDASYVFRAWLKAGGGTATVENYMVTWARLHSTAYDATFVFRPWLMNAGSWSLIEGFVLNWLSRHGQVHEAHYIYAAWLNAGGPLATVQPFLHHWMNRYGTSEEGIAVYEASLNSAEAPS
ncbi:MAG TPA: nuclease-related domain-containing protein [Candidatus Cybelea sp.]|jgi:hypothetical protein|nr:nuclease-related domain-containing protein [Candidatus Cybelea sp.]